MRGDGKSACKDKERWSWEGFKDTKKADREVMLWFGLCVCVFKLYLKENLPFRS